MPKKKKVDHRSQFLMVYILFSQWYLTGSPQQFFKEIGFIPML